MPGNALYTETSFFPRGRKERVGFMGWVWLREVFGIGMAGRGGHGLRGIVGLCWVCRTVSSIRVKPPAQTNTKCEWSV